MVLYLLQELHRWTGEIRQLLYHQSGLLGVSGVSSDMRTLLPGTIRARLAVDLFCYRIARELGSLAAALGGLDAIVFTGGIGEHAAPIRERVSRRALARPSLDAAANAAARPAHRAVRHPRGVGRPDQRRADDRAAHARCLRSVASRQFVVQIGREPFNQSPMHQARSRVMTQVPTPVLANAKALVVGVANEHSIAYGCAKEFDSSVPTSRLRI